MLNLAFDVNLGRSSGLFSYEIASADHLPPLPVEENFDCETDEESYFEPGVELDLYLPLPRHPGTYPVL